MAGQETTSQELRQDPSEEPGPRTEGTQDSQTQPSFLSGPKSVAVEAVWFNLKRIKQKNLILRFLKRPVTINIKIIRI